MQPHASHQLKYNATHQRMHFVQWLEKQREDPQTRHLMGLEVLKKIDGIGTDPIKTTRSCYARFGVCIAPTSYMNCNQYRHSNFLEPMQNHLE